jgi:excisionase family DNA binding protein
MSSDELSFLRPGEVARALGVSVKTVANYADRGDLKAVITKGGHRRFTVAEVRRYLQSRRKHEGISFPEIMRSQHGRT